MATMACKGMKPGWAAAAALAAHLSSGVLGCVPLVDLVDQEVNEPKGELVPKRGKKEKVKQASPDPRLC